MPAEIIYDVRPDGAPFLRHPDRVFTLTRAEAIDSMRLVPASQGPAALARSLGDAPMTIIPTSGGLLPWWVVGLTIIGGAVLIGKTLRWMR